MSKRANNKSKKIITILVLLLSIIIIAIVYKLKPFAKESTIDKKLSWVEVKYGPLSITVAATGTIQNREQEVVRNLVEGSALILSIVPEGKYVKKGELLVELDASGLKEKLAAQQIIVQNAEAGFIRSRENLAVVKNKSESDISKAKLVLKFAKEDVKQYTEGEYPQILKENESSIIIAKEKLARAKDKYESSKILAKEKYLSQIELAADKLAAREAELRLDTALGKKEVLCKYTYNRKIAQLNSDVKQAIMALKRIELKASADIIQASAELKAKESEFERKKLRRDKIKDQIDKCKLYAPISGMVVYATTGRSHRRNREPLEEGQEVRERQELIFLPTAASMVAAVKVHEASLDKISTKMLARLKIDALPNKTFTGRIEKIGLMPDAQSMWMNPDLKVYGVKIFLDEVDSELRPGMSCQVDIVVKEYEDVMYIPLQCVIFSKGKYQVYVFENNKPVAKTVEVGLDNNRMIIIKKGLKPGDKVWMAPPMNTEVQTTKIENGDALTKQQPKTKSKYKKYMEK